jgi:hypothetical protein
VDGAPSRLATAASCVFSTGSGRSAPRFGIRVSFASRVVLYTTTDVKFKTRGSPVLRRRFDPGLPGEVKDNWDFYNVKEVIHGGEAFQPLAETRCRLVTK